MSVNLNDSDLMRIIGELVSKIKVDLKTIDKGANQERIKSIIRETVGDDVVIYTGQKRLVVKGPNVVIKIATSKLGLYDNMNEVMASNKIQTLFQGADLELFALASLHNNDPFIIIQSRADEITESAGYAQFLETAQSGGATEFILKERIADYLRIIGLLRPHFVLSDVGVIANTNFGLNVNNAKLCIIDMGSILVNIPGGESRCEDCGQPLLYTSLYTLDPEKNVIIYDKLAETNNNRGICACETVGCRNSEAVHIARVLDVDHLNMSINDTVYTLGTSDSDVFDAYLDFCMNVPLYRSKLITECNYIEGDIYTLSDVKRYCAQLNTVIQSEQALSLFRLSSPYTAFNIKEDIKDIMNDDILSQVLNGQATFEQLCELVRTNCDTIVLYTNAHAGVDISQFLRFLTAFMLEEYIVTRFIQPNQTGTVIRSYGDEALMERIFREAAPFMGGDFIRTTDGSNQYTNIFTSLYNGFNMKG